MMLKLARVALVAAIIALHACAPPYYGTRTLIAMQSTDVDELSPAGGGAWFADDANKSFT